MEITDTVKLLRECDSGTKMAVTSIDEVLGKVENQEMKKLLEESKSHHGELGNRIHGLLLQHGSDEKDPTAMAKGMSWIKTNIKMGMEKSDATVADLITDGCNMGVKSLHRYLNQYQAADSTSKGICKELISIEEKLAKDLRYYL
ncbi:MAG: hypothetical protein GX254_06185 [Clostridiales bacterium]|jgi:hypothetical protein|nr:hypothetical protein [Clostridiales bacterium]